MEKMIKVALIVNIIFVITAQCYFSIHLLAKVVKYTLHFSFMYMLNATYYPEKVMA